mgnify:CR=1 FL=1
MKKMKKLVGILLTLAMVVAMSITTFAAENSGYRIYTEEKGHTYEVYQIFTGDWDDKTEVLSNVKWGKNGKNDNASDIGGTKVDESILSELAGKNSNSDTGKLAVIEKYADLTSNKKFGEVTKDNPLQNVPVGYYLIKDQDGSQTGKNSSYTLYVVNVVKRDVEIKPKGNKPTVVKKLKETNDTTGKTSDWQDGADYDIGDIVPFELTGTLPSNYADYKTYKYVFHDTLSEGLTYNEDAKVFVKNGDSETDVTKFFTVDFGTITCNNLKDIATVTITKDSKIVVRYSATLNEHAKYGKQGNPNEVYLEYSNNPNYTGAGENSPTGQTPLDAVIVFTYKLDANKVEPNGENGTKPLKGAGFTLFKIVPGTEAGTTLENQIGAEVKGTDVTKFSWLGLDAGKYVLRETTTPAGYNTAADIEFEIVGAYVATTDTDGVASETKPELTGLVVKDSSGNTISGDAETGATFTATLDSTRSDISTNVVNRKGTNLPETGGMGTTILYVVGAILVIGAGILLVTKKRMNANK